MHWKNNVGVATMRIDCGVCFRMFTVAAEWIMD